MAHFVSLGNALPLPEDDVEFLYATSTGVAQIGLWGFWDGNTRCTVRVIAGPGTATAGEQRGTNVQVWRFTGLSNTSKIQAFSGDRPFTGVLEVRVSSAASSLAQENSLLLNGSNPSERAFIGGAFVPTVPLTDTHSFGVNMSAPKMESIRGLAVHITAGPGSANGFANTFAANRSSAHFVIDRSGVIAQYVAASIKAQAQGVLANPHFLSVEMVGVGQDVHGPNPGACQEMTGAQLSKLRELWAWVRAQHPSVPNRLAWAYSGSAKRLSAVLTPLYQDMAKALADLHYCNGAIDSVPACVDSWGLSCHYWLDTAAKPCPGLGIMGQLPEILGYPRVRVTGDAPFVLS